MRTSTGVGARIFIAEEEAEDAAVAAAEGAESFVAPGMGSLEVFRFVLEPGDSLDVSLDELVDEVDEGPAGGGIDGAIVDGTYGSSVGRSKA